MTDLQIIRAVKASVEAHGIYMTANKIGVTHSTLTRFLAGMHCQGHVVSRIADFAGKPLAPAAKPAKKAAKPKKAKAEKKTKPAKKAKKAKAIKKAKKSKPSKKPIKAKKASKPRAKKVPVAPVSTPDVAAEPAAAE